MVTNSVGEKCRWVEEEYSGDLILMCCDDSIELARIPQIVVGYSSVENGEKITVNVMALRQHIEKEHQKSCN